MNLVMNDKFDKKHAEERSIELYVEQVNEMNIICQTKNESFCYKFLKMDQQMVILDYTLKRIENAVKL